MEAKQASGQAPEQLPSSANRRPPISQRTITHPASPQTHSHKRPIPSRDLAMLTPPASPPRTTDPSGDLKFAYDSLEEMRTSEDGLRPFQFTSDGVPCCPFHVDILLGEDGDPQIFGRGAWSTVFKAIGLTQTAESLKPAETRPKSPTATLLVAVKHPNTRDAFTILRNEAQILTRLQEQDAGGRRIARFYGIRPGSTDLVLAAHPLSLEDHIQDCAWQLLSSTTAAPVIGPPLVWLDLVEKLVDTLHWLHNEAQVVHGDLKPGNILLEPLAKAGNKDTRFGFRPLLIDFSSSQRLDSDAITPNTLSAVTMEYTAPELLCSKVLNDPKSCATTASDVFSLAVSLLVAATGEAKVYPGYSIFQRRALATQGHSILDTVRSISPRVPKHGVVSQVLEKAFLRKDLGRIDTRSWKRLIYDVQTDISSLTKL